MHPLPQTDPPLPPWQTMPTMYDLPSENPEEPGLPDEFHDLQPQLLSRTLRLSTIAPDDFFTGADLNLYYDSLHTQWYKRPDWFLAIGVPRLYRGQDLRNSYVVWQERQAPFVIVELLSPGTEAEDLGPFAASPANLNAEAPSNGQTQPKPPAKWQVYEQILRVPYYVVFSRYTRELRFFRLVGGRYQEHPVDATNPRLWIPELDLGLGLWEGTFEGISRVWLRWYDATAAWVPTDAEQALQRAEQAEAQVLQVAQNLLRSGMAIAQVSELTGLSLAQLQDLS
jgi:Uma2 family endonuclease